MKGKEALSPPLYALAEKEAWFPPAAKYCTMRKGKTFLPFFGQQFSDGSVPTATNVFHFLAAFSNFEKPRIILHSVN